MKETDRTRRINADLDEHFKSNKGAWWVNNEFASSPSIITLHRGIGGDKIKAVWVALRILRKEPSVSIVHYSGGCAVYTRASLRGGGYKI